MMYRGKTHKDTYLCLISRAKMEQVSNFRVVDFSITENLSWTSHISLLVNKKKKKPRKGFISLGKIRKKIPMPGS